MKDAEELLSKATRSGPTFFQLNFFVIGKEPTNQAKMHKCLQEIKERTNTIKSVELEIAEVQDNIALLELDIKFLEKSKTKEQDQIHIRQIKRKISANMSHLEALQSKIETWHAEINFLKHLFDQIAKVIPLKPWDDYEVQLEYWNEKMTQEIRSRLIMNAPVDIEVIKTAMSLPDAAPIKQQLLEYIEKSLPI